MSKATYDAMYMQYMGKGSMHKLSESVADGSYHLKLFISFEIFGLMLLRLGPALFF